MEFISCVCRNEVLVIETDKEFEEVYLALFELKHKYSLLNKLRLIWYIIKNGHPYTDEIVLDKNSVKKLIKILQDFVNKTETKK